MYAIHRPSGENCAEVTAAVDSRNGSTLRLPSNASTYSPTPPVGVCWPNNRLFPSGEIENGVALPSPTSSPSTISSPPLPSASRVRNEKLGVRVRYSTLRLSGIHTGFDVPLANVKRISVFRAKSQIHKSCGPPARICSAISFPFEEILG